jgi:phytoene/squalene synthetase
MPERQGAKVTPPAAMTRAASMQSYLTIRWLADRAHRADAFALYAYFRWLDDMVDVHLPDRQRRLAFVARQRYLLAQAADGTTSADVSPEEALLTGMLRAHETRVKDGTADGLVLSLTSMLDVMEFDARRRGRAVTQRELDDYTHTLAVGVTEALHHCIGHGCRSPRDETRYVAVTGAHVAHMLRDLVEDLAAGYINVPAEVIGDGEMSPARLHALEVRAPAIRAWVRDRVELARSDFATGRRYLERVENPRCRLAGHAYIARFEWVLDVVERDGYRLRPGYPERSTLRGGLSIAVDGARSALAARGRSRPAEHAPTKDAVR